MKIPLQIALIIVISTTIAKAEILSISDERLVTERDLGGLSVADLRIARNEIFARHGYSFSSTDLFEHFSQYDWYRPRGQNVELSNVERQNVEFIRALESNLEHQMLLNSTIAGAAPVGVYVVPEVPVMIYRENDLDPCAWGQVGGLRAKSGEFLSVHSGPGQNYPEIDRLYNGDQVQLCDSDGDWSGIIYLPRQLNDCRSSEIDFTYPYQGSCSSGWLLSNQIIDVAG
jgi:hypothetical protein